MRVTEAVIKEQVGKLNKARGFESQAFNEETGRWTKGAYDLRSIPEGYQIVMLKTITTGATEPVSNAAFCAPREVYAWLEGALHNRENL